MMKIKFETSYYSSTSRIVKIYVTIVEGFKKNEI